MNHIAHIELIRIHHAEMLRSAEHHRLVVVATRQAAQQPRPGRENLLRRLTRRGSWALRGVAEAEPWPP